MDPSRDPRRRDRSIATQPQVAKRAQSRSPESSGPPRKVSKTAAGVPQSRQSPLAHASPRAVASESRRQLTAQLQSDPRAAADMSMVNSPDSLGSRRSHYEDAPSGHGTPIRHNPESNLALSEAEKVMSGKLGNVFGHMAGLSRSLYSRDEAAKLFNRASTEYNNMINQFQSFPIIKEQKTMAKDGAEKALKECEKKVTTEQAIQQQLIQEVATVITQALNEAQGARPSALLADFVSRAEYEALEKRLEAQMSASEERMNKILEESEERISTLKDSCEARFGNLETGSASTSKRVSGLESRTRSSEDRMDEVEKEAKLTKARIDTSQARFRPVEDKVSDLDKKMTKGREELNASLNAACKIRHDSLVEEGQKISMDLEKAMTKVEAIEKSSRQPVQPSAPSSASSLLDLEDINRRLDRLEFDLLDDDGIVQGRDTITMGFIESLQTQVSGILANQPQPQVNGNFANQAQVNGILAIQTQDRRSLKELKETVKSTHDLAVDVDETTRAHREKIRDDFKALEAQIAGRVSKQNIDEMLKQIEETNKIDVQDIYHRLEEITSKLGETISRSDLDNILEELKAEQQSYRESVEGAYELITSVSDRVDKLKAKPGQVSSDDSPSVNGVSPLTNGVHGHAKNHADRRSTTSSQDQDVARKLQALLQKQTNLEQSVTVLTVASNDLEFRFNNLTTDVVVQAMVDEMSKMYPDAKNCQNTVSALKGDLQTLAQSHTSAVQDWRKEIEMLLGRLNSVSQSMQRPVQSNSDASTVLQLNYETLRDDLVSLKEQIRQDRQNGATNSGVRSTSGANQHATDQSASVLADQVKVKVEDIAKTLEEARKRINEATSNALSGKTLAEKSDTKAAAAAKDATTALTNVLELQNALKVMSTRIEQVASSKDLKPTIEKVDKLIRKTFEDLKEVKQSVLQNEQAHKRKHDEMTASTKDFQGKIEERLQSCENSIQKVSDHVQVIQDSIDDQEVRLRAFDATRD